jgi:hypothetical protein
MKRLALLFAALMSALIAAPATAFPGPDRTPPQPTPFHLHVQKGPAQTIFAKVPFMWRTAAAPNGWDFGGRTGYACGFAELVVNNQVVAEIIVQKWGQGGSVAQDGDSLYAYINSSGYGATAGDQPCGRPRVTANGSYTGGRLPLLTETELSRSVEPGMPTGPEPHATGHVVQVFGPSGAEVVRVTLPHQEIDPNTWWFRGDESGELMLWYLEPSTGEYGIVARLSCAPLVAGYSCADYLTYG